MKLTLAMIALQLNEPDVCVHVKKTDETRYRSSRTYRSQDNLYVYQQGNDTVVVGDDIDSYILLPNTEVDYVQNRILDIFDFYADWVESIAEDLKAKDYQSMINRCFDVFQNPIFTLSANSKVIAITDRVSSQQLNNNPEWAHLVSYGFSSFQNYRKFRGVTEEQKNRKTSDVVLYKNPPTSDRTSFIVSMMYYNGVCLGRITIMEYLRKFTSGDYQLLKQVSDIISQSLYWQAKSLQNQESSGFLFDLIARRNVSDNDVLQLYQFFGWDKDTVYRVCTVMSKSDTSLSIIQEYLEMNFRSSPVIQYGSSLVILLGGNDAVEESITQTLNCPFVKEWDIRVGVSLEFKDIKNFSSFYKQSEYAVAKASDQEVIIFFYQCAIEFMLGSNSIDEKMWAMHPDIVGLLREGADGETESLTTLYTYLVHERSPRKASEALFIHRNTLLYRISRITEKMVYDIDDAYTRQYMILSLIAYSSFGDNACS